MSLTACLLIYKIHHQASAKFWAAVVLLSLSLVCAPGLLVAGSPQAQSSQKSELPSDLAQHLDHLQSLHIDQLTIKDLKWLHSKTLTELEIETPVQESLTGISHATALTKLKLNLRHSPVKSFRELGRLKELNNLTLILGPYPKARLSSLDTPKLDTLDLTLAEEGIPDFNQLSPLKKLRNLTVAIKGDTNAKVRAFKLQNFAVLSQIAWLKLDLENSSIQKLPDFSHFDNLDTLNINLTGTTQIDTSVKLMLPKVLKKLTLNLDSSVENLPDFDSLTGLTCLALTLNDVELPSSFTKLTELTSLTLDLKRTRTRQLPSFEKFTKLTNLSLTLNPGVKTPGIDSISALAKATKLTDLKLDLQNSDVQDISPLAALTSLKSLDIDLTCNEQVPEGCHKITDFGVLSKITSLKTLTIHLNWSDAHLLPDLAGLSLSGLVIFLEGRSTASEESQQVARIMQLTKASNIVLNLPAVRFERFPLIPADQIRYLTLNIPGSSVDNLDSISDQKQLRGLIINLENDKHIWNLPALDALKSLGCISLLLHGSGIDDLSELKELDGLLSLFLDLRESQVSKLPSLRELHLQTGTLILNSEIADLQQIQGWDFLDTVTVDYKHFASLAAMPHSVTNLNFMVRQELKGCGADQ